MIDSAPLDLFGDEADDDLHLEMQRMALCQWCGVEHPADGITCPDCGATLLREVIQADSPLPAAEDVEPAPATHCPWCDTPVTPDAEQCPTCYATLVGDPDLVLPGVNVPLHESVLWAREMAAREAEDGADPTDTALDLLMLVGRVLLRSRGWL